MRGSSGKPARRILSIATVLSVLLMYSVFLQASTASAAPFSGGFSPKIVGLKADLNGDATVDGKDDSNAFYGDTSIIDGLLDCDAWGVTANAGTAGDGSITPADNCTLVGYDGTSDGTTITVVSGLFALRDGSTINDGTFLPTVFPDPNTPNDGDVGDAKFAWSTINGRVDSNGDEAISADDCHFGLIGTTADAGLGTPTEGVDIIGNDGTNPCGFGSEPAAADNGLVDLNSDGNITLAGDSCNDDCFFDHDVKEGVVLTLGSPDTTIPTSHPDSGGFAPKIFGSKADLNGDGVVDGKDDSNAFYGDTSIIDGQLDCNAWGAANDGAAGNGSITAADDCTLIGYDGTSDGTTITVVDGNFTTQDGSAIADGTLLPTVFPDPATPDDADIGDSNFAWSTINGRVDSNGDEAISADDCHFGIVGATSDAGLGDPTDGSDIIGNDGTNPCGFASEPAVADNGLVDVNSDGNITSAGDTCTGGCFFDHDVLEGVVQELPDITINNATVSENAGTATFTVSLSFASASTVTVHYATSNQSATAGSDYTAKSGTVTFVPGDTSEPISVAILDDSNNESSETFLVNLSNASHATIADALGLGTIVDNDAPITGETPGLVRGNTWLLRNSNSSGAADITFHYGLTDDFPVTGDWDGNGTTTPGLVRGRTWLLKNSNTGGTADVTFSFGRPGDYPITGDWDGNGTTTPGVVRGTTWLLKNSNSGGAADVTFAFGRSDDFPVTGDWDGNGTTTPGLVRGATWLLKFSNTGGSADSSFTYGRSDDFPVTGDWDGDGVTTPGLVRSRTWLLKNSNSGGTADNTFTFGRVDDFPVTGDWDGSI